VNADCNRFKPTNAVKINQYGERNGAAIGTSDRSGKTAQQNEHPRRSFHDTPPLLGTLGQDTPTETVLSSYAHGIVRKFGVLCKGETAGGGAGLDGCEINKSPDWLGNIKPAGVGGITFPGPQEVTLQ